MNRKHFIEVAKQAQSAAKQAIAKARLEDPSGVHVHRGVEISISKNGEREGEAVFLEVKTLSGKNLEKFAAWFDDELWDEMWISGGVDTYEDLECMMNGWDYEPWTQSWELQIH